MGCALSNRQASFAEAALCNAEVESGFKKVAVKEVDFFLRKYSSSGVIQEAELMKALRTMNPESKGEETRLFLTLKKEGNCRMEPVLVTFLLVASAQTKEEKLEMIFEAYDPTTHGYILEPDLRALIRSMLLAATRFAPRLLANFQSEMNREIRSYVKGLEKKVEAVTLFLTKKVMKGGKKVTLKQFLDGMTVQGTEDLSRCTGIREMLQRLKMKQKASSSKPTRPDSNTM